MKTFASMLLCVLCATAYGQSNVYNASNYGAWTSYVATGNASTGSSSLTVNPAAVIALSSVQFVPFQANEVITIDKGLSKAETLTVTPSNCFVASLTCTLAGSFTFTHKTGFNITSGTFGLQEAINQALLSPPSGTVLIDATWQGPAGSSLITAAVGAITVVIQDNRSGTPQYYQWNGSAYVLVTSGGGSGTVTSFSAGNLSPLFTSAVATATTTPALTFSLSNAAQNSVLAGPATGGAAAPSYQTAPTFSAANLTNFPGTFPASVTGIRFGNGASADTAATTSQVQTVIGNGVYVPVGGYYGGMATGAVNVLAISLATGLDTPTLAQLTGVPITFIPNLANTTTTPTLTINALAATTIVKGTSTALVAGDIPLSTPAVVIYNGTNFILQNPQVGITQTSSVGNFTTGSNLLVTGGQITANSVTGNLTYGSSNAFTISSSSNAGTATLRAANNSGTGNAGNTMVQAGAASGGGQQGFANVQQSFTTASALAATFEAVSMTTTADQVAASATGSTTNVGIAQTIGGTGTALFVVSHGKTTARFDGTPVIGDVACYPLSGGTVGLLHDNGSTACTLGESAGVVTGQVSGTGSGATATVEIK